MIHPDELQAMPKWIEQLMRELQDWGINDIAGRLVRAGRATVTAEYEMKVLMEYDTFQTDWKKALAEAASLSEAHIETLFNEAAHASYSRDKLVFQMAGAPFVPFEENHFMQSLTRNIIDQTVEHFENITRSMGFARHVNGKTVFEPLAEFYQKELNLASTKVAAGMQSFEGAVREAVERMADSGLRTVPYASGKSDRIDVAARRAVLSSMKEMTNRQSHYNAQAMGLTTFEFSWHGGHRPSHGWGGRRYDRLGVHYPRRESVYEKYGGGTTDDYNCYHSEHPVFPDSPPSYTDKELRRLEAKELEEFEYEGKLYNAYAARQQQRALERMLRKQKSLIAGYKAAQPELAEPLKEAKSTLLLREGQYRAFSSAMGLPTEFDRVHTGLA